jgi:hypothetical protein
MSYVWLSWLADDLRREGCTVVECDGWESRGRPASAGAFDPYGVLWHHTGTTTSDTNTHPTLNLIINGRSDLPGPLAQAMIGYDGTVYVVAAGRANHAGGCNGYGPFYDGDGNAQMVGWEIDYDGTQHMSAAQQDAATRASAAVLRRLDRDQNYAARHEETSSTGKWDTGHVTGDQLRGLIHTQLATGGTAPAPEHQEVDMFYGTSPDGKGWLCNGIRKTWINSPRTRDTILGTGVPTVGEQPSDFWNEFPTDEGIVSTINTIAAQTK